MPIHRHQESYRKDGTDREQIKGHFVKPEKLLRISLNLVAQGGAHHRCIQTHNLQNRVFRGSNGGHNPSKEGLMCVHLMGRES